MSSRGASRNSGRSLAERGRSYTSKAKSPEEKAVAAAARASAKAASKADNHARWARRDQEMRLAPGTNEKLGSHGFVLMPPSQLGEADGWGVMRSDGKDFLGQNYIGDQENIRWVPDRASVEQFATLVAAYPGTLRRVPTQGNWLSRTRVRHEVMTT